MKKIILIGWGVLLLTACSDFLDLKPKNVKTPQTLKDVEMMVAKYLNDIQSSTYDKYCPFNPVGSYYSNEPFCYFDGDTRFTGSYFELIDNSEVFEWHQVGFHAEIWNALYKDIGTLNLCLYELEKVSGDEHGKKQLKAELLMHRAFLWTRLMQFFAPYRPNKYVKDIRPYGITIFKGPEELAAGQFYPSRLSQQECFRVILDDLQSIEDLQVEPGIWNMLYNKRSLHGLWAEVYWWKAESCAGEEDDWQYARKHAGLCIDGQEDAHTVADLKSIFAPVNVSKFSAFKLVAPGIYTYHADLFDSFNGGQITDDLIALYSDDDIRKAIYFESRTDEEDEYYVLSKFDEADRNEKIVLNLWRISAMKLIIAESYFRENNLPEAIRLLREFKQSRMESFVLSDEHILEEIILERRKEFVYEPNNRWLDMKRYGVRLERTYPPNQTAVLESDDFRYTFQIPIEDEISVNPRCFQNPGWEIVKFE